MAEPFAVWGKPRKDILDKLTHSQRNALQRYIESVTGKCYRIAFDCGVQHGINAVRDAATAVQRERRSHQ